MDFHLNCDLERVNEWTWMEALVVGVVKGAKISFLGGYAALTLSSTNEHCLESFWEPACDDEMSCLKMKWMNSCLKSWL